MWQMDLVRVIRLFRLLQTLLSRALDDQTERYYANFCTFHFHANYAHFLGL